MSRKYAGNGGANNHRNNRMNHQQQDNEEGQRSTPIKIVTPRKRPAGLVNLGNTCFMNAALQCLSRTPNLLYRLEMLTNEPTITFSGSGLTYNNESQGKEEQLQFTLTVPPESMVRRMVHLLHQMTEGSGAAVNPRNVHHMMTKNFGAGLQHDSHELLRHILDKLKKDQIKAFRLALMKKFNIPIEEGAKLSQSDPQKANMVKEWDRKLYNTTVIDDIFGGELLTTRTCLECKAVKTSCEEFLDISLPIRVVKSGSHGSNNVNNNSNAINNRFSFWNEVTTINRTLQECFQCFTEPETLSGNNKVDCEKCHESKLNLLKSGVPVEQVFPLPEPEESGGNNSASLTMSNNNKYARQNQAKKKQQALHGPLFLVTNNKSQQPPQPQQQSGRKKKRRKTRREKMAENPFPESRGLLVGEGVKEEEGEEIGRRKSENGEEEEFEQGQEAVPELEKIADEGYSEDFKESDDSTTGTSGPDLEEDQQNEDDVDEEEEEDEDENINDKQNKDEASMPSPKQREIPKSTKTSCQRQTMIYKPPQNLTIHLKRFTVSTRGFAQKLSDHVKFTEYINIKDYVTDSLPSVDDHEEKTRTISTSSWSFEELIPRETDMLGGASGDSHEFRHERGPATAAATTVNSGGAGETERTIEAPVNIPIKIISTSSLTPDQNMRMEETTGKGEDGAGEITTHPWLNKSVSELPESCGGIADSAAPSDLCGDNTPASTAGTDQVVIKCEAQSPLVPSTIPSSSSSTTIAIDDVQSHDISNQVHQTSSSTLDSSLLTDVPSTVDDLAERLEDSISSGSNQANKSHLITSASTTSYSPSPWEPISSTKGSTNNTYNDDLEPTRGLDEDATAAGDEEIDETFDDEPPPYPGSPVPDSDDTPRETVDVTLPDSDGSSNWREFKNRDIVQWSFNKSEDKPDSPEPILSTPLPGSIIPLPPPAPPVVGSWSSTNHLDCSNSDNTTKMPSSSNLYKSTLIPNTDTSSNIPSDTPSTSTYLDLDQEEEKGENAFTMCGPFLEEEYKTHSPHVIQSEREGDEQVQVEEEEDDAVKEREEEAFVTDPNGINYRLYGIVEHGGSLNWGHYVAYIRVNSDWYYISDSYVSHSDISTVLSRDPYILFYERVL